MKDFLKKYEKIVKILLILLIFFLVSVLSTVILSALDILYFVDGEIQLN